MTKRKQQQPAEDHTKHQRHMTKRKQQQQQAEDYYSLAMQAEDDAYMIRMLGNKYKSKHIMQSDDG